MVKLKPVYMLFCFPHCPPPSRYTGPELNAGYSFVQFVVSLNLSFLPSHCVPLSFNADVSVRQ